MPVFGAVAAALLVLTMLVREACSLYMVPLSRGARRTLDTIAVILATAFLAAVTINLVSL